MKRTKKLLILLLVLAVVAFAIVAINEIVKANIKPMTDNRTFVVGVDTDTLSSLVMTSKDGTLSLFREADSWIYAEDPTFVPDPRIIDEALTAVRQIKADKVLPNVQNPGEYGLDAPAYTVTAVGEQTVTIQIGIETALGEHRYISIGDGNVYIVRNIDLLTRLPFTPEDLVQPDINNDTTITSE